MVPRAHGVRFVEGSAEAPRSELERGASLVQTVLALEVGTLVHPRDCPCVGSTDVGHHDIDTRLRCSPSVGHTYVYVPVHHASTSGRAQSGSPTSISSVIGSPATVKFSMNSANTAIRSSNSPTGT